MMTATQAKTPANREMSILKHAATIERVAWRVLRNLPAGQTQVEYEDLVSVGMVGLLQAWERHDEDLERFDGLVEMRVRGAMVDELRRRDFFPRRLRAKAKKLKRAERALEKEHGRRGTREEVAAAMGMTVEEVEALRAEVVPYSFVDSDTMYEGLVCSALSPFEQYLMGERRQALLEALGGLSEREQIVLELRYVKQWGQRQIAEVFGLTEGRISQIHAEAIKVLRVRMSEWAHTLD
jgi:RNA polymerase sigma factor for flagellar operon FliA